MGAHIVFAALLLLLLRGDTVAATCPHDTTYAIGSFSENALHPESQGAGLTLLRLSSTGMEPVALHAVPFVGPNPNYVALEGSSLLVVNAVDAPRGGLTTLTYSDTAPFIHKSFIGFEVEHPAHVSVAYPYSEDEPIVLVSNFKGGDAFAFMYGPDGKLQPTGVFTVPELRADPTDVVSHVHSAFPYRQGAIVCDYGRDKVYRLAISRDGALSQMQVLQFQKGDEPRHSAIHTPTDVVYVICEKSQVLVTLFREADDTLKIVQRLDILPTGAFPTGTASAVRISADNRFVYAAVRRDPLEGRIAAFPILDDGRLGERLGDWSLHGVHPRDFFLAEGVRVGDECKSYVAVVNMNSNSMLFIRRDVETGTLSSIDFRYSINGPTSVLQI